MPAERLRFAPSPTGYFHVGSARTILYNWLLARKSGGSLLLRIDDTDTERNREEWVDGIVSSIQWLGLDWDLGPVRQSSRLERYAEVAAELESTGHAYWCGCTREEVEARKPAGSPPGYDGFCRDRRLGPAEGRALRFRVPENPVTVSDLVRGEVVFPTGSIEDFIVVKSSGAPLYVLANAVDDADFEITLVVRAEEHLPTTPKAVLIHQALGHEIPRFAHLPVLVNEARQKLSKRRDRVAIEDFRDQGYLPEAMINYLALLGWSPGGDREFFTIAELEEEFSFERVSHSPAFFDERKLAHFNKHYIQQLSEEELLAMAVPFIERAGLTLDPHAIRPLLAEVKPRISTLEELPGMVDFLLSDPSYEGLDLAKFDQGTVSMLGAVAAAIADTEPFTPEKLESRIRALCEEIGVSLRKLQEPVRLAITAKRVGVPLFSAIAAVGRPAALRRLSAFSAAIG